MRAFYDFTHNDAAARLSRKIPKLEDTRAELDILGKLIIGSLAERKQYAYNPELYDGNYPLDGIHQAIMSEVYKPILRLLCENDRDFELTETVRRIDREAMSLLQKRLLKAYDVAAYKIKHNIPIPNKEREEEVLNTAEKNSKESHLDPKIGRLATEIIIEKTIELEEIIKADFSGF
jgi:chorismate mutase